MSFMNSKSLSPIIGTLIILGIALVVAGITYTWTSTYTQEQTKAVEQQADVNTLVQAQSAIGLTLESTSTTGKLIVANNTAQSMTISSIIVDGTLVSISPVTISPGGIASIDANAWLSEGQTVTLITTAGASKTITVTEEALTQFTSTLSFSDPLNDSNYLNPLNTNANITSGEARLSGSLAWLALKDLNVSNNNSASVNPSVALDSNGNPSIAWYDNTPGNNEIFYRDWNGSDWTTVAGDLSGPSLNVSNNDGHSVEPSLALDVNGNPSIAWDDYTSGNWEIYYRDWNGSNWVTAKGNLSGNDLNASNNSGTSKSGKQSLALDANGNPSIAWYDYTTGNFEIYYREWDEINWVTVSGSLVIINLNVSDNPSDSVYPSLALDSNGFPSIAWYDNTTGNYEIFYRKWNGSKWVTASGETGRALSDFVWVANYWDNTVSKIHKPTGTVTTINVGNGPSHIAVDDKYVWVANESAGTVSKVNKDTNAVEAAIGIGSTLTGVAVDETYVWVTRYASTVYKINKLTNSITTIPLGFGNKGNGIAVDTNYAWVPDWDNEVSKINKSTNAIETISIGALAVPWQAAVDGTHAWITNRDADTVSKINKATNAVETIIVGDKPYGIAVDNTYAWVANRTSGTVSKINKATNTIIATISPGSDPSGVSVDDTHVWVTRGGSNQVWKINKSTDAIEATITVGNNPWSIGDATGYAFDFFGFAATPTKLNVSSNSADSVYNSLALDVNDNPSIAWEDYTPGNYADIYYRDWNRTNWVTVSGSLGTIDLNASNTSGNSYNPSLALAANGNPSIAWYDNTPGNNEIFYRDWNGNNWATANGNLTDADLNVSKNSGSSYRPSLALNVNNGNPSIAWRDNTSENWEIYYRERDENFVLGNTTESIEVDSTANKILSATLTASTLKPAGTSINFFLSNDNGASWTSATSGIETTFSSTGSQLKWRADLNSSSNTITPRIYDVSINYAYEA